MLRPTGLGLVGVGLVVLLSQPCWADVIPSKRARQSGDGNKVACGLEKTGLAPAAATHEARQLTQGDLAYFATGSDRVQVVGGLILEELLFGALLLVAIGAFYLWRIGLSSD